MTHQSPSASDAPIRSTLANDPDMADLIELFVSELPNRVELLRVAAEQGRASDVRDLAHQLKGAAGGYGFAVIGEAAADIETPLRSGAADLNSVRRQVDALIELCSRVSGHANDA